jgi:hypothetical protein
LSAEPQTAALSEITGMDSQFTLSVRTSMVNEYRDASGILGAFELNHHFTGVGALRAALVKMPGIQFEGAGASMWGRGSSRFTLKKRLFAITTPFQDVRIAPADPTDIFLETEELLKLVGDTLFPKWTARARSRFYRI